MKTIEKIWLTDTAVWIETTDGERACERLADYPRLRQASKEDLENFTTDVLAFIGKHWTRI